MEYGRIFKAEELTDEHIAEYREVFDVYDKNKDGVIEAKELEKVMRDLGQNPSTDEIIERISEGDINGDGTIDFQEFLLMMAKRRKCPKNDDDLQRAFDVFDKDGNGYISRDELKSVMETLGERLTEVELDEMLKEADKDGDGQVNYEEFVQIMEDR
ncbi:calmodulin-like isoform X2 [Argopecten irradians]|uniref:calmodulin-like isoform X2 n=1 Tax=Argopecten irradians TaxID=31199 RepID=UPI0037179F8D